MKSGVFKAAKYLSIFYLKKSVILLKYMFYLDSECEYCLKGENENGEGQVPVVRVILQLNNPGEGCFVRLLPQLNSTILEKDVL